MDSIDPESALGGIKNGCTRTNTVFFPISQVSEGTVSLQGGTSIRDKHTDQMNFSPSQCSEA